MRTVRELFAFPSGVIAEPQILQQILRCRHPLRVLFRIQVTHVGSAGESSTSDESSFRSRDYTFETKPFDLSPWFNVDVVANPGDASNGTIDGGWATLIVEGFDGTSSSNSEARGLPPDRRFGVHLLGD